MWNNPCALDTDPRDGCSVKLQSNYTHTGSLRSCCWLFIGCRLILLAHAFPSFSLSICLIYQVRLHFPFFFLFCLSLHFSLCGFPSSLQRIINNLIVAHQRFLVVDHCTLLKKNKRRKFDTCRHQVRCSSSWQKWVQSGSSSIIQLSHSTCDDRDFEILSKCQLNPPPNIRAASNWWWYSNSPLIELLLLPKLFGDAFVTRHFNTISIRRSSRSKFDYSRIYTRVCLLLFPFHVDAHIQNRLSRCPSLGPAIVLPVASAVIQKRWKVNALLRLSFQGVNSYPPAGRISSRYMLNPTLFLQLLFFYSFVLIIYKQGDHTHVVLTLAAQRWSLSLDPSLSIRHLLSLSFVLGSSSSITTDGEKRNAREPLPFYRPFQLHPTTPTFCVQDPLLHS